jgi:ribosomal protein L31
LGHGPFGPSYLHLLKDSNGNVFSWITTVKLELAEGARVKLDATVKQHKLYNGVKQTVLTRAKQLEEV